MAKKKNILLTHGSLHVPADQMMSIDIEGAPALVKQVSIYDFNHELLYNKTAPAGKELSQGEISKIQRILNRARVLVGHSLDSDLMALRRRGVYLYNDTRCLDTYFTLLEMKAEGLLDNRYNGATLKETALYFHIRANDYHTSHTDALATTVVMQEMLKLGEGMVVEITPSIIQIPRPPFGMEPDWEKEERGDMQQNKTIGPKADSRVYKIGDFYECVIAGGQGPTFVRMTQEEYDLFLRIRELRPDYTVRLYSETILTPSIVARLAALEEAEKAEAAPVATVTEEVEVPDISEEPKTLEEIEEAPVPALEEEPTEEYTEETEVSISEEIEETPVPASEEVTAEEICEDMELVEDIEEPPAAEEETNEEESGEGDPLEIVAPETEVEEAAEEGYAEVVAAEVEVPRKVSVEETDAEIIFEEMAVAEEVEAPDEEVTDAEQAPEEAAAEAEALAEEISCELEPAEVVEAGEEAPMSYGVEEASMDWPEELPPLPEETLEMTSEMPQDGASEPLFGEGIWDLPEDFLVVKEKAIPAEEHRPEEKKDSVEEDAFSMNLFGE